MGSAGPKAFAALTGQALAETSDRSIEDPVVIPTTLAAAKALASLGLGPARGAGSQADTYTSSEKSGIKRIQPTAREQHPQGIKAPPQTGLFG